LCNFYNFFHHLTQNNTLGYSITIILLHLVLALYNYNDDLIDTQNFCEIFVKGTVAISLNQLKE